MTGSDNESSTQYINSDAHWHSDEETKRCSSCSKSFSIFVRRHHCRCCGNIFCDACSNKFLYYDRTRINIVARPHSYYEYPPYRTCQSCFENLEEQNVLLEPQSSSEFESESETETASHDIGSSGDNVTDNSTGTINRSHNNRRNHTSGRNHHGRNNSSNEDIDDDDANHCPICNMNFKKLTKNTKNKGDGEHLIEHHIEECIRKAEQIQQHHGDSNGTANENNNSAEHERNNSNNTNPSARNRMLVYRIPKPKADKDGNNVVINEDDYEECPICFEQMLPGEKVGRLECLCCFHYHCIKSWFAKKSQNIAAVSHGEEIVDKNFCPLHDAVF